jgi:hypothetical protein
MAGPFACLEFGHVVAAPLEARMRQAQIEPRFRFASVARQGALQQAVSSKGSADRDRDFKI